MFYPGEANSRRYALETLVFWNFKRLRGIFFQILRARVKSEATNRMISALSDIFLNFECFSQNIIPPPPPRWSWQCKSCQRCPARPSTRWSSCCSTPPSTTSSRSGSSLIKDTVSYQKQGNNIALLFALTPLSPSYALSINQLHLCIVESFGVNIKIFFSLWLPWDK